MALLFMVFNQNKFNKLYRTRTYDVLSIIDKLLGRRILLFNNGNENRSLVGIKNSLIEFKDSRSSQLQAVLDIYEKYKERRILITQSDLDRFAYFSCPNFQNFEFKKISEGKIWISALDALELFEHDITFLLGPSVAALLDGDGQEAKKTVLRCIRLETPSSFFGRGSKVTLARYRQLVRATESGWRPLLEKRMAHLRASASPETESDLRAA